MTPERIKELVNSITHTHGTGPTYILGDPWASRLERAIIQAINETKDEDIRICRTITLTEYGGKQLSPDNIDYVNAILASKVKYEET